MSPQDGKYLQTSDFSAVDSSWKATIRRLLKQNGLAITNLYVGAIFADFTRKVVFPMVLLTERDMWSSNLTTPVIK